METDFKTFALSLPTWHPVRTYIIENLKLNELLSELESGLFDGDWQRLINIFNQIATVDIRYTRKENQLFPYLEKHGWNGPSQGMWAFHDANRDILRLIRKKIDEKNSANLISDLRILIDELRRMMSVEEYHLLPYSLELIEEREWETMREGEEEIGWAFGIIPAGLAKISIEDKKGDSIKEVINEFVLRMNEGKMSLEQINLMLKFLPIDLTYVDESDRVVFYNRGEERVFPRSAGVIGREVRFCHPPKSVGTVLKILEEFKKGTKTEAEFWIDYRGKKIHIRYFAILDEAKKYRGVIEVSQDITSILKITGERRLLDWE